MDKLAYIALHTTVKSDHVRTYPRYDFNVEFSRHSRTRWFETITFWSLHRLLSSLENVPVARRSSNIRLTQWDHYAKPSSSLHSVTYFAIDAGGWDMFERLLDYMSQPGRKQGDVPKREELVRLEDGNVVKRTDL